MTAADSLACESRRLFRLLLKYFIRWLTPAQPPYRGHLVPWSQGCSLNRGSAVPDSLAPGDAVKENWGLIWIDNVFIQVKNSILINFKV